MEKKNGPFPWRANEFPVIAVALALLVQTPVSASPMVLFVICAPLVETTDTPVHTLLMSWFASMLAPMPLTWIPVKLPEIRLRSSAAFGA